MSTKFGALSVNNKGVQETMLGGDMVPQSAQAPYPITTTLHLLPRGLVMACQQDVVMSCPLSGNGQKWRGKRHERGRCMVRGKGYIKRWVVVER